MRVHGPAYLALLWLLVLAACDCGRSRAEYDRQLEICSVAEGNGFVEAAVEACGGALAIADREGYAPDEVSDLSYRLARLERQLTNFERAEELARRSLALAETGGDIRDVALRLVELAPILAGQDRWLDGLQQLDRALPLLAELDSEDRRAAANVFKLFGVRLGMQGYEAEAERCQAAARDLAQVPPE